MSKKPKTNSPKITVQVKQKVTAPQPTATTSDHTLTPIKLDTDQAPSAFAWQQVCKHYAESEAKDGDFGSYANLCKAVPALIMSNGLMQTLAFLQSKYKEAQPKNDSEEELRKAKEKNARTRHHSWLLEDVFKCLSLLPAATPLTSKSYQAAMNSLVNQKSLEYRMATEQAMATLRWLRQFASAQQALLGDKKTSDSTVQGEPQPVEQNHG
ncbi:type III-B CRISPR module-associated protein Cmr5 [Pokkaliibacter sp. MBI-7]|uniref:type III-B CRISPR module-associated protein Cmr5 n=1 Tax=Pokkaliibacter sp. MBI-7 TaxID=3040600 RepID=UPI00244D0F96|nr:type III-B CRISPR module-associated protein Cmr5 [Pokkaliibacter sp. MBI-7]MDH2431443.1 type III-B CRISPR module-associated protein Cmr5 [Pokkaliibacter sp. MBI-7]